MSVERATDASFWRGEAEVQNRAAVRAVFAEGKTNGELQPGGRAFRKHSWARRIAREAGKSLPLRATSEARSVPRWPVVPRDPGEHLMKDCRPIRSVWPSRDASCYVHFYCRPGPVVRAKDAFSTEARGRRTAQHNVLVCTKELVGRRPRAGVVHCGRGLGLV